MFERLGLSHDVKVSPHSHLPQREPVQLRATPYTLGQKKTHSTFYCAAGHNIDQQSSQKRPFTSLETRTGNQHKSGSLHCPLVQESRQHWRRGTQNSGSLATVSKVYDPLYTREKSPSATGKNASMSSKSSGLQQLRINCGKT